ncbi:FAD-containing oxidoreductase [Agrobacterium larrymoorei]|uniref:FAD-containing oxidoreductase n=1 Tax=Agrobacterium larrymoorei TaxID=160699 RepID=A0A4D7DL41_9HYPH|nr:FAD-containing oxidoreductase [Agrobacterium larrymoorei]QCI96588.1 FAD-containing oxidoreductase [Agrobacterium larrymoorei]QYA07991.1 FAD-containing oxidoreductase [Agrobacterium larrymoorei]
MTKHFDAIIIGAGQAGPSLAGRLTQAGRKVALIERKHVGGTCVNTGCMPTKAMVASAYAAHMAARAEDYGVRIQGKPEIDFSKVMARKDIVRFNARKNNETWLEGMENCTLIRGHARFEDAHSISVDGARLTADMFFINTGGRAAIPDYPGLPGIPYLTNVSLLDLDRLPAHLAIIGGSYIALEFAQMFRRFGSNVTVIERGPRLIGHEDEDVSAAVKDILADEGIDIRLNAKTLSFSKHGAGVKIAIGDDAVEASHVLIATGRRPNTDDLGLEKAGVELDAKGFIGVDDRLKTNIDHIYALGDCNGQGAFTHTSYNDFEIVAANLLDGDDRKVSDRIKTFALYIDPPLGRVGMTEREARATGRKLLLGTRPMSRVGRAVEKGETLGFMKVIADAGTDEILGASILGTGGDEAVQSILDVMYARKPYTMITRAMHIHPTVSELIPTVFDDMKPAH